MSAPPPVERVLLAGADRVLSGSLKGYHLGVRYACRLDVLDAAASVAGGFDLATYRKLCLIDAQLSISEAAAWAAPVLAEIRRTKIPVALALSALAREPLSKHETRTAGAHYTDFRLALLIGRMAASLNTREGTILDPAAGAGMLLAATSIVACNSGRSPSRWLAERVIAADQSQAALRGARLSLASLTNDAGAIAEMSSRWLHGDSLLRSGADWRDALGSELGVIVANPPWEKLKVLRHEHETAAGIVRHYGAAHAESPSADLLNERDRMRQYADAVISRYPLAGRGETDLFVAFTQLMVELAGDGAGIAALLPAGLIRSKSTTALREMLLDRFGELSFTVLDNKPKFFEIDTRFKFLAMTAQKPPAGKSASVSLGYGQCTNDEWAPGPLSKIDRQTLQRIRPDLSMPEVRSLEEWDLFRRMNLAGQDWSSSSSPWWPHIMREVDMTRERATFLSYPAAGAVPLIEGRMVHQFRFGAKVYVEGSGRRATWQTVPLGVSAIEPQFWIRRTSLPPASRTRVDTVRAGFCDIAGQTNERSMMAAVIPEGVACGNKVPTIHFPNLPGPDALDLWCGMVNSFAFDWLLRRVLTTTVNYFLLQSVPLPPLLPTSLPGRRVAMDSREIASLSAAGSRDVAMTVAELRREIDLACFRAYELTSEDAELVLGDFPILDRTEPPLPGEIRSTVTKDFLLSGIEGPKQKAFALRSEQALNQGARPYRCSQSAAPDTMTVQPLRAAP